MKKTSYFNLRNTAWQFLIDNNIEAYPLDICLIAKKNNWIIKSYQEYNLLPIKKSQVCFWKNSIIILYDNQLTKPERRFAIAHEIGHIVLNHYKFNNAKTFEREAKMFAARILMPITLIHNMKLFTPKSVMQICNVSFEAATWRLNRYYQKLVVGQKFDTSPLEQQLYLQLESFIKENKNESCSLSSR